MKVITRSQFICTKLEEFFNSSEDSLTISLYSKEARIIERRYKNLEVKIGDMTLESPDDKRNNCVIQKK